MTTIGQRYFRSAPFFYGWVIVGVAALANISRVSSAVEVLSLFVPHFVDEFHWNRTLISSAVSFGGLAGAAIAPLAGRLVDRYGPRVIIAVGGVLVGIGCLSIALLQGAVMFILGFGLMRLAGQGIVMMATPVATANWFVRNRGKAMAVMFTCSYVGIIIAPPAIQGIINLGGWRSAWVALAALAFAGGVIPPLLFLIRRPEDVGMLPDGGRRAAPGSAEKATVQSSTAVGTSAVEWTARQALRTPAVWLVMGATLFSSIMVSGVGLFQVPYYIERGVSPTLSAIVISTFAIGLSAGSIALGWLADRTSARGLMIAAYLGGVGVIALLIQVHGPPMAFLFALLFGIMVGGIFTLNPLLLATYYGRLSLGSIMGVAQMAKVGGLALGPLVAGVFYDVTQSYENAFITFAALSAISAGFMVFTRPPQK